MAFDTLTYDEQLARLMQGARDVLADYGLDDAHVTALMYVNNAVFSVDTGDTRYALRIHRRGLKRPAWIRSELRWLEALRRDAALCVPQPVPTGSGKLLGQTRVDGLEKPLHCALFRWMEGEFRKPDALTPADLQRMGTFIARLHDHAARFRPPEDFERPALDWEGLFGEDSPYNPGGGARIFTPDDKAVFAAVADRARETMDDLGQSPETFGLIHADFIAKNVLFGDERLCAIDFDDCSFGYYLYDMAPLLLNLSTRKDYDTLKEALWVGYTTVRPLPRRREVTAHDRSRPALCGLRRRAARPVLLPRRP